MAFVNAPYANAIIENKVNDYLLTKLDMSQFLTVDTSLEATDGMKKTVHRYKKTGAAQTVSEGNANTSNIGVQYEATDYTVTTSQATFVYSDEGAMKDSYYVDKGVEALAEAIVNEYRAAAIDEFEKTSNIVKTGGTTTAPDFDDFADAIAELDLEDADEAGFFALVNPAMKANLRKSLKGDLSYVEAFVRAGYIGSVCGIPVYTSKEVSDGKVIIANKEAVTCFMKKEAVVEQDRNITTRSNTVVARNVKVIALTDESKCAMISMEA